MSTGNVPSVFVSSTCYDLGQVRADLEEFLTRLGLDPVLSESNSFPIDPDSNTVENCLEAVRKRCDIFILIIGSRYGTQTDSGKSVTNLEYLEARAQRIPIFVFITKTLRELLPVWKKNPDADFSGQADSTKLFEFVDGILDAEKRWCFSFETAQHIKDILRNQLALLFMDALELRLKVKRSPIAQSLSELSGEGLRLALERPTLWDARIFCEEMAAQFNSTSSLKRNLKYGVLYGDAKYFSKPGEALAWINSRMVTYQVLYQEVDRLFNEALNDVVKQESDEAKLWHILWCSKALGQTYNSVIEWRLALHRVKMPDDFKKILSKMAEHGNELIDCIETVCSKYTEVVNKAAGQQWDTEQIKSFQNVIRFGLSPPTEVFEEIERIKQLHGMSADG